MQPCTAVAVLNETATYREFAPPPPLRGAVACLWMRRGGTDPVRVIPDACSDVVWRSGAEPVVAGPDTTAWLSQPGLIVGLRFLPGAGGSALGVPLRELRDRRVSLSELGIDVHAAEDDPNEMARALVALATGLVKAGPPDRLVQAAALRLLDGRERIETLADDLGVSERHLRRRFHAAVGYGPKTLQRVLRLRAALRSGERDLALVAADAGYADQAHLTRECRRLTGLTPGELRRVA